MWYGMFESLTISQSADAPFLMNFQISFVAWKERFRSGSPYKDTIHNDVKRGHDYGTWQSTALAVQQAGGSFSATQSVAFTPNAAALTPTFLPIMDTLTLIPPVQPTLVAPAVTSAQASNTFSAVDPTANDTTYSDPVINYSTPTNYGTWNGILSPLTVGNTTNNVFGGGSSGGGGAGGTF